MMMLMVNDDNDDNDDDDKDGRCKKQYMNAPTMYCNVNDDVDG